MTPIAALLLAASASAQLSCPPGSKPVLSKDTGAYTCQSTCPAGSAASIDTATGMYRCVTQAPTFSPRPLKGRRKKVLKVPFSSPPDDEKLKK